MTTAEAAQKWAEANEALAKARDSLTAAQEAHKAADLADKEAWETLQNLSGRRTATFGTTDVQWTAPAKSNGEYSFDDGFKR